MKCPPITWKDGDERKEFSSAKIKACTTYEPTILPYINESLDINEPILYSSISGDPSAKSLYDSKNMLLTLLVNNDENILGIKYFSDVKINKTQRDGNVDLNITFNKNIIDNGLNLELNCYYNIYSNTVKFEIKKKDETTITFLSPYKLIPPSRIKGSSSIQSGKLIFRPYADKEKYFNRPPATISHKRTVLKTINNYLKDLKDLLENLEDKNKVKIDVPYEIINKLINQKIFIDNHNKNYNKYLNLHVQFNTKIKFDSYINKLKSFYDEYLKLNKDKKDLIPIEELISFKKEVEIGSDYIHENDVINIKKLSVLDSRFKLIEITEVQQIMVDDNGDNHSIPFVKKFKRHGYKKKLINKEINKYIPVNYGYFKPFTFYDIITDKFKKINYYEAFGINKDNYIEFYKVIEEFKLQCLNLISLYNHLLLVSARYVNITDQRIRTRLNISKNTKNDQLITKIKFNEKEICFFNEFINNTIDLRNFETSKFKLIALPNISVDIIDSKLTNLTMHELINIELLEGNTEKKLENYIKENNISEANKLFGDIIGIVIDTVEKKDISEIVFDSLLSPEQLDEIECNRKIRQEENKGRKTFSELASELSSSGISPIFKPKIVSSLRKERVKEEEEEEDSDYITSSSSSKIGMTSFIEEISDPLRHTKRIIDLLEEPLRYYRKEQGDNIRKRMNKHKKGSKKSEESYKFFIDDKIKQFKKNGIKEDDHSHNFIANLEYDLLMGKNDFKIMLIFYLTKIQHIYNKSFDMTGKLIESSDYYIILNEDEREICNLFLNGEKTRNDNLRANGIKLALKYIKEYNTSSIAKQSILEYLNKCENIELTNYMKKTYNILDEDLNCKGGESIIRRKKSIIDILSDKSKIDEMTSDDLKHLGINPSKRIAIDQSAYKEKIKKILNKVIPQLQKKLRNNEFIDNIYLKLSTNPSLSIDDVINSKHITIIKPKTSEDKVSDTINLGNIDLKYFDESQLSKIKIITTTTKDRENSNKIFDKLESIKRKTKLSDSNKTDLKNIIFDKLSKGKNYQISKDEALEHIVKLNEANITSRLMNVYRNKKFTIKDAQKIALKIINAGLTDDSSNYILSDSEAYDQYTSKKEKYLKYKTKYLNLIEKLKEKGILI